MTCFHQNEEVVLQTFIFLTAIEESNGQNFALIALIKNCDYYNETLCLTYLLVHLVLRTLDA